MVEEWPCAGLGDTGWHGFHWKDLAAQITSVPFRSLPCQGSASLTCGDRTLGLPSAGRGSGRTLATTLESGLSCRVLPVNTVEPPSPAPLSSAVALPASGSLIPVPACAIRFASSCPSSGGNMRHSERFWQIKPFIRILAVKGRNGTTPGI